MATKKPDNEELETQAGAVDFNALIQQGFDDIIASAPLILSIVQIDAIQRYNGYPFPILSQTASWITTRKTLPGGPGQGNTSPAGSGGTSGTYSIFSGDMLINNLFSQDASQSFTFDWTGSANITSAELTLSVSQDYSSGALFESYLNQSNFLGTLSWAALDTSQKTAMYDVSTAIALGTNTFTFHYHINFPALSTQTAKVNAQLVITTS